MGSSCWMVREFADVAFPYIKRYSNLASETSSNFVEPQGRDGSSPSTTGRRTTVPGRSGSRSTSSVFGIDRGHSPRREVPQSSPQRGRCTPQRRRSKGSARRDSGPWRERRLTGNEATLSVRRKGERLKREARPPDWRRYCESKDRRRGAPGRAQSEASDRSSGRKQ